MAGGGFNLQVFSDPGGEFSESAEDVSVARDQFTFAVLNGSQCAKPVDLQFEEIFLGVERFGTAGTPNGAKVSQHSVDYKSPTVLKSDGGTCPV